jgi:hypothetical protein
MSAPLTIDFEAAAERHTDNAKLSGRALDAAKRLSIDSQPKYEKAVEWCAEIKERHALVSAEHGKIIELADRIKAWAGSLFGPALRDLSQAEAAIKEKIATFNNNALRARDELLRQVESAPPEERSKLITQASLVMPSKVAGCSLTARWSGEVTDAAALVKWAVENNRPELLQPNKTALGALTKSKDGDPHIPGWTVTPATTVTITPSRVKRS